ncbi:hypothetical protein G6F59_017968 [Rhizopus arrhizus]|nr:hypothetical protein G6F59_017968 [Rhizopus arrhizus]
MVDGVRRVAAHHLAAAAAVQPRAAREQQLQVVVQFGHRADRAARTAHRVGLVDRDGGQDAFDAVHLRLVHARRCPSAYSVSKASELLPDPDTPVTTTNSPVAIVRSRFLRLFWRAPTMRSWELMDGIGA